MSINQLVKQLKANGEDYEFYPTTDEMIRLVNETMHSRANSILDIGCGNGATLAKLQCDIKYGIEKSQILLNAAPPEMIPFGRDFMQETLIDKKVDVIFCNPPYSAYEAWTVKMLEEAHAKELFVIIPQRWRDSALISRAIEQRSYDTKVLGSFDFLAAQRKARAKVDVIQFTFHNQYADNDPFTVWFANAMPQFDQYSEFKGEDVASQLAGKIRDNEITTSSSLIDLLIQCYNHDMAHLIRQYQNLAQIDFTLLHQLGVELKDIKGGLKAKINNLKALYWNEVFQRLEALYNRLTKRNRAQLLGKIDRSIGFTHDNIYAIVMWSINHANLYMDQQLVDLFKQLSSPKNIKNYRSNQKTWSQENWRWCGSDFKQNASRYQLEYRVIHEGYGEPISYWGDGQLETYSCYSSSTVADLLGDIATCARTLGYVIEIPPCGWVYGKGRAIHDHAGNLFMQVRLFKNGNMHMKFNQAFIKRLNIQVSRILKWVKDKQAIVNEMGYSTQDVVQHDAIEYKLAGTLHLLLEAK